MLLNNPFLMLLLIFLGVVLFWAILLRRELIDLLVDARVVAHEKLSIPQQISTRGFEVPLRRAGLRFGPHPGDLSLNDILAPRMVLYDDRLKFHAWVTKEVRYRDIQRLSVPGGGKFVLTLGKRKGQLVGWLADPEAVPELVHFFYDKGAQLDARAYMIFRDFSIA